VTLPRAWFTPGTNPDLWGTRGTYTRIDWADLPPLDAARHDGTLAWLAATDDVYGLQYGLDEDDPPDEEQIAEWRDATVEVLREAGLSAPPGFVAFFTDELHRKVPTCTACWVELPARLASIEGHEGRFLRFMNDQQSVRVWGLWFADGACAVACAQPEWLHVEAPETFEDATQLVDAWIVADDFESFVHRFWLENTLWDVMSGRRPLTTEEAAYVAHARARRRAKP